MPCYDTQAAAYNEKAPAKINELTAMLCETLEWVEATGDYVTLSRNYPKIVDWWTKHKAIDEKRKAEKAAEVNKKLLIRNAKSKLTKDEIKALGI